MAPFDETVMSDWVLIRLEAAAAVYYLGGITEWTTGAGGHVPIPLVPDYRRRWVYDGIPYQVKQRAGDQGITAENMEKLQHADFNEDTTNENARVACSNIRLWKLDSQNEETRLDAFEMKGLRKILRVSWTAKKTNEWVLNDSGFQTGVRGPKGVRDGFPLGPREDSEK